MPIPEINLADSAEGIVLQQVFIRVRTLTLPGLDLNERLVLRKQPWLLGENEPLQPPCVIISPASELNPANEGTNERDDVVFGAMITILTANERDVSSALMGTQTYWRERIRKAFQSTSRVRWAAMASAIANISGTDFLHGWVESGEKYIPEMIRRQYDASYYLVRVACRESREGS